MMTILTAEEDVITSYEDINDYQGEVVEMLIVRDDQQFSIIGCRTLQDVAFYAVDHGVVDPEKSDVDEWIVIRAKILDPTELPYSIEFGSCAYVFYQEDSLYMAESMEEVVRNIEGFFEMDLKSDIGIEIEDFAVVSCEELPKSRKEVLKKFMTMFKKRSKNWN